jgi:hypothetical protein
MFAVSHAVDSKSTLLAKDRPIAPFLSESMWPSIIWPALRLRISDAWLKATGDITRSTTRRGRTTVSVATAAREN